MYRASYCDVLMTNVHVVLSRFIIVIIIIIIIIIISYILQVTYNYMLETYRVSWVYLVAAILCLQFMAYVKLLPMINDLCF